VFKKEGKLSKNEKWELGIEETNNIKYLLVICDFGW
jgi:hypothetical protein